MSRMCRFCSLQSSFERLMNSLILSSDALCRWRIDFLCVFILRQRTRCLFVFYTVNFTHSWSISCTVPSLFSLWIYFDFIYNISHFHCTFLLIPPIFHRYFLSLPISLTVMHQKQQGRFLLCVNLLGNKPVSVSAAAVVDSPSPETCIFLCTLFIR